MKFSIVGLIGLFSTTTLGAPSVQPPHIDDLSGDIKSGQSDSIEYLADQTPLTFRLDTTRQHSENWLGIYPAGHGPSSGAYPEDSLVWRYVPEVGNGEVKGVTVHPHPSRFSTGDYEAYLLWAGGYEILAGPAKFRYEAPSRKRDSDRVAFIPTTDVTLANAKVGTVYESSVQGLLRDAGGVSFLIDEESWASIDDEGLISGTPTSSGDTKLTITAFNDGSSATLSVVIPVVEKGANLVSELSVMTYNLWGQGKHVNDYHAKQVAFLAGADVDIVGLQESDKKGTEELADALWWWHYEAGDGTGIISRYPITADGTVDAGISVTVDLGDSKVHLWDVHLTAYPYGPYNVCFENMSTDEVIKGEEEARGRDIRQALGNMKKWYDDAPVILVGDFNAPSHLDWTKETSKDHCDAGAIDWPTSKAPIDDADLKDAYREIHPDPSEAPGNTWSPIWDEQELGKEPQDRIDFIYHHKGLTTKKAVTMMVGEPNLHGDHEDNQWTSDHKAVVAVFSID